MRLWMLMPVVLALGWVQPEPKPADPPEKAPEKAPEKPAERPAEQPAKPAEEPAESLEDLLKRLEKAHKQHNDFQGDFTQDKFIPLFGDTVTSSGRFVFQRPDQVRWEYTKPHESILVVTGDSGSKWSRATNRVEAVKLSDDRGLDAVVKQLFTWFRGEFTKLTVDYDVAIESRKPLKLKLTPKSEVVRKYIAAIEVSLEGDDRISQVRVIEPQQPGDDEAGYTRYTFTGTRLGEGVKAGEFEIKR